jgi:hypothetical protein
MARLANRLQPYYGFTTNVFCIPFVVYLCGRHTAMNTTITISFQDQGTLSLPGIRLQVFISVIVFPVYPPYFITHRIAAAAKKNAQYGIENAQWGLVNVLGLDDEADFGALHCQPSTNVDRSTEPQISCRCC